MNIYLKQFEKKIELQQEVDRLEPLFKSEQEYKSFVKDHNRHVVNAEIFLHIKETVT